MSKFKVTSDGSLGGTKVYDFNGMEMPRMVRSLAAIFEDGEPLEQDAMVTLKNGEAFRVCVHNEEILS